MPKIEQVFVKDNSSFFNQEDFERRLYLTRKKVSNHLRVNSELDEADLFYICLLYTSPSPRDQRGSRMPSSA